MVPGAELGEQVRHVGLGRGVGDVQAAGYLRVRQAGGDEAEYFALAAGEHLGDLVGPEIRSQRPGDCPRARECRRMR